MNPARRHFLNRLTALSLWLISPPFGFARSKNVGLIQPLPDRYLGEVKIETRLQDEKIFTEGPAVDQNGNVYFTNIPMENILKWEPSSGKLSTFLHPSNGANGLRFTMEGDLLICEGGPGIVSKLMISSGKKETLVEQYDGKKLQSPNDLDFDAKGRIYFSSRQNEVTLDRYNVKSVFRLDPDGQVHQLLREPQIDMPNGLVISPDETILYLIEAHPDENRNRKILAFDLDSDGSLSNRRTLYDFYPGRSGDGMCIDQEGNLYVAAGLHDRRNTSETLDTKPGIYVISPNGEKLDYRETPEDTITNCTFGGSDLKTLYITCGSYLLSMSTRVPGKTSYLPIR